jgi:glycosyltransferase involved in cell wall biosynthesis
MDWTRNCAAVIPCFNEAAHIGEVVAGVRRHLPTVIVVDDGSTDGTAADAAAAGAELVRLPRNTGKGAALRAGWRHAHGRGFPWALNLDGDGQHAPDDLPRFFERAEQTHADLVVGNRLDRAETMPWVRRRVNQWMTRRLARLTGAPLADSQCGFRLLNLDLASRLPLTAEHFEIESELLVAVLAAGGRVSFVPVQVIYQPHASKIHPVVDGWRWLRWWFKQQRSRRECRPPALQPGLKELPETHA